MTAARQKKSAPRSGADFKSKADTTSQDCGTDGNAFQMNADQHPQYSTDNECAQVPDDSATPFSETTGETEANTTVDGNDENEESFQGVRIGPEVANPFLAPSFPINRGKAVKRFTLGELHTIQRHLDNGHAGDADIVAHLFRNKYAHDPSRQEWYVWTGNIWSAIGEKTYPYHLIMGHNGPNVTDDPCVVQVYRAVADQLQTFAGALPDKGTEDEKTKREKFRAFVMGIAKQCRGRAKTLCKIPEARNVLALATSDTALLMVRGEQWDRIYRTGRIHVRNGAVDLTTGKLMLADPTDYIRSGSDTEYQGLYCPAPRFLRFLEEIFEDRAPAQRAEMIGFLQRVLGYAILAQHTEHIFVLLYGENGRNGKDVLMSAIRYGIGAMLEVIPKDVFIAGKAGINAATPGLVTAQGKRIIITQELDRGERMNMAAMKGLTGSPEQIGRPLYGGMVRFPTTFTPFILTNNLPHMNAGDAAAWQRALGIELRMQFTPNGDPIDAIQGGQERQDRIRAYTRRRDPNLDAALQSEASGILSWIIRGAIEYQRLRGESGDGLRAPLECRNFMKQYRNEEDTLGVFIRSRLNMGDGRFIAAAELYDLYRGWCDSVGILLAGRLTSTAFGKDMVRRFDRRHTMTAYVYVGICAKSPGDYTDGAEIMDSYETIPEHWRTKSDVPDAPPDMMFPAPAIAASTAPRESDTVHTAPANGPGTVVWVANMLTTKDYLHHVANKRIVTCVECQGIKFYAHPSLRDWTVCQYCATHRIRLVTASGQTAPGGAA